LRLSETIQIQEFPVNQYIDNIHDEVAAFAEAAIISQMPQKDNPAACFALHSVIWSITIYFLPHLLH
jgi:hypothetical protein